MSTRATVKVDPDDAYRFCVCGWEGHSDECPKDPHFGFSRCPKCGAMIGTGLCMGKRAGYRNRLARLMNGGTEGEGR